MAREERQKERKAVTPWRPFSEMARLERDMEQVFDDFFGRRLRPLWPERWWRGRRVGASGPAVDLYEEKDEIVAKIDVPGLGRDDIQVNITDNLLTIKGEKKREEEIKEEDYYYAERSYGSFARAVELPGAVQVEKVKASFKNGVLEIRLPKSEEAKKREVKVTID